MVVNFRQLFKVNPIGYKRHFVASKKVSPRLKILTIKHCFRDEYFRYLNK